MILPWSFHSSSVKECFNLIFSFLWFHHASWKWLAQRVAVGRLCSVQQAESFKWNVSVFLRLCCEEQTIENYANHRKSETKNDRNDDDDEEEAASWTTMSGCLRKHNSNANFHSPLERVNISSRFYSNFYSPMLGRKQSKAVECSRRPSERSWLVWNHFQNSARKFTNDAYW